MRHLRWTPLRLPSSIHLPAKHKQVDQRCGLNEATQFCNQTMPSFLKWNSCSFCWKISILNAATGNSATCLITSQTKQLELHWKVYIIASQLDNKIEWFKLFSRKGTFFKSSMSARVAPVTLKAFSANSKPPLRSCSEKSSWRPLLHLLADDCGGQQDAKPLVSDISTKLRNTVIYSMGKRNLEEWTTPQPTP